MGIPEIHKRVLKHFEYDEELYQEVGTYAPLARFFTLQRVNTSAVRIHSLNGSFPDTFATLEEYSFKVSLRATFGGTLYRGIMRSNGDGSLGCCATRTNKSTGEPQFDECPVISWWSADGTPRAGRRPCTHRSPRVDATSRETKREVK